MAVVHLLSDRGSFLALDATTNVSKTRNNSLTSSSVMSGAKVSDGFTIGNPSISFSGICSYTKVPRAGNNAVDTPPAPDELNVLLDEMVVSQERFTLYGNDLIPDLKDVVIISYNIIQSGFENAVEVAITVEQVFITETAQKTRITKPASTTAGDITEEEDKGQGNKTQQDPEQSFSLLKRILDPTIE